MLLRTALIQDTVAIADLEQELFPENCISSSTVATELDRGPCFVIVHGPFLMGYALVNYNCGVLDVLRIGISESCRRLGLGEGLLRKVLVCKHRVAMLTVQPDNTPAIRLYKKLGFEFYGRLQHGGLVLTRTSSQTTAGHN